MENWISFWKITCIVFFVAFYILVIFIIPKGAKDIKSLFAELRKHKPEK